MASRGTLGGAGGCRVVEQIGGDEVVPADAGRGIQVAVLLLHDTIGSDALALRLLSRFDHAPGGHVGDAGDADEPLALEFTERADRLGERDIAVVDVSVEHIDVVDAEVTGALRSLPTDDLGREALEVGRRGVRERLGRVLLRGAHLGGDAEGVAVSAVAHPPPEEVFAVAAVASRPQAVVVRRVDEGAARLDETVEDRARGGLVGAAAEVHRSQAQGRDVERGASVGEGAVLHGVPFSGMAPR